MRKMDREGRRLCEIQAELFEKSILQDSSSSKLFVQRFMNSNVAIEFDSGAFLDDSKTIEDVFEELQKEYHYKTYGSIKYHRDVMYWVGYLYRYFCYCYQISSSRAYKYLPFQFVAGSYASYHTLDVAQAIERLLEERDISFEEEALIKKGVIILRKIRNESRV